MKPTSTATDSLRSTWLAWTVLVLSLGAVTFWASHAHQLAQQRHQAELVGESAALEMKLEERMRAYEQVLRGAAALFEASPRLTRGAWAAYARSTRLREHFPDILGLGFAPYIDSEAQLARLHASAHAEGLTDFSVRPQGRRTDYGPVAMLEPFDASNAHALGYDMLSDPVRREAMELARDTGEPAISARVRLLQARGETAKPGLLHYLPVYRPGSNPSSVAERRAALVGWVYIPYFSDDLLGGIRGPAGAHLRIYDGPRIFPDSVLYDSDGQDGSDEPDITEVRLSHAISVGGRSWKLILRRDAGAASELPTPTTLILVLGTIASVLLAWMVRIAGRTRNRAEAIARAMTTELQHKRRELESANGLLDAVLNAIPATVGVKDASGRFILMNAAARALHKVDPEHMLGRTDFDLYPPEQAERNVAEDREVLESGERHSLEAPMRNVCGEERWVVRHKIAVALPDGGRGVLVVVDDITERKQAAAKIESQWQLLDTVLADSPSPQWVKDEDGRFILMNEAAAALLGSSAAQFIGKTAHEVLDPELADQVELQDRTALGSAAVHNTEGPILAIDGQVHWGIKRKRAIRLPDGRRILLVSVMDLTEQRRAQQQLESARAMLDAVFDAVPAPIAVKDQNGRFLLSNPANQELLGIPAEMHVGLTDRDLYTGEQLQQILNEDADARRADRVLTIDTEFTGPNGIWHCVVKHKRGFDLPGGGRGVVVVMHDVTPLRRAAQELERSQAMLHMVMETLPNPVFVKDSQHRWIVHNQASCDFLGLPRESLEGKSDFDVFPAEQAQRLWAQDDEVLSNGEPIEAEEPFITAIGEMRWVLKSKRRGALADGTPCVVGSITDITRIKQAEAQARGARQMAEAILDASPSPLWVKDEDSRFILVNDAGARLLGRTRESLLGHTTDDLYPPELAARIAAQDAAAFDSERQENIEGLLHSVDREARWGIKHKRAMRLPDGRRVLIVSVNDLTEQRAAQQAVERGRQFLEKILDSAPLPMFVKDAQHRFVVVNAAFSKLVHHDQASLVGKTDLDIASEEWARACFAQDDAAFTSDYPLSWEDHLSSFDGSDRWISRTKCSIRLNDGSRYIVGVNVDITNTKRAIVAAERSRGFLDALVAALPQPVFVMDRAHRYVILNDAFCQLVGRPRTELLGRSDFDVFAHEVAAANWQEDDKVFDTGERHVGVQAFRTLTGASGWMYKTKVLLRLVEGAEYLVGAATDITGQKEAALAVERSKLFLDAVLNAIPGAVVVKDIQRRVVVANDALCRAMQHTREQLIGTRLEESLSADARRLMEGQDDEAFASEDVVSFEHPPFAPGDEASWILTTKRAVTLADGSRYMVGVNTDVTAIKRAAQELRETQERLRVLNQIAGAMARMLGLAEVRRVAVLALARAVTQARISIAALDPEGRGRVVVCAACTALPGLDASELEFARVPLLLERLRGGSVYVRTAVQEEGEAASQFEEAFRGVGACLHVPLRLAGRLAGVLWADAPVARAWTEHERRTLAEAADYIVIAMERAGIEQARQDAEGEVRRHRDNLQELVAERTQDLREAVEAAERANRAKSEFLTNMSHELRTPMHAILSFARLGIDKIAQGRLEAHKLQLYFGRIDQSGERLLALLNDLLDLSKLESGHMEYEFGEHGLMDVLRPAVQEFAALASTAGVHVSLEDGTVDSPVAWIDPGRIGQVVRNLLSNAIKFTPAGGTVRIALRQGERAADMQSRSTLQVRVTDSGIGIPRQELEAVFHKFVQGSRTRSKAGGTGLGLAICREIIQAHGGRIWVESESGRGSTFIVALPAQRGSSPRQAVEYKDGLDIAEAPAEGA